MQLSLTTNCLLFESFFSLPELFLHLDRYLLNLSSILISLLLSSRAVLILSHSKVCLFMFAFESYRILPIIPFSYSTPHLLDFVAINSVLLGSDNDTVKYECVSESEASDQEEERDRETIDFIIIIHDSFVN